MISPMQTDATLFDVICCVHLQPRRMLLRVVAQSLKPVKLLATCKRTQQLPVMLGVAGQQFCVRWYPAIQ